MSFLSTLLFPFLSYSLLNSGLLIFTEIRAVHSAELNPTMGIVIAGLSQFHGHARVCVRGCADALCLFAIAFTYHRHLAIYLDRALYLSINSRINIRLTEHLALLI